MQRSGNNSQELVISHCLVRFWSMKSGHQVCIQHFTHWAISVDCLFLSFFFFFLLSFSSFPMGYWRCFQNPILLIMFIAMLDFLLFICTCVLCVWCVCVAYIDLLIWVCVSVNMGACVYTCMWRSEVNAEYPFLNHFYFFNFHFSIIISGKGMCPSRHVKVRRHVCGVSSLHLPLCSYQTQVA